MVIIMYRIMLAKSKRDNFETLYQFMTTTIDGVIMPLELESKESLDAKVEKMLNVDGYSKADFIIVEVIDYSIDANSYTDDPQNKDEEEGDGAEEKEVEDAQPPKE